MSVEQRKYARVESSLACSLATATDVFEAVIANLSKGGAAVIAPLSAANECDTVTILVERSEGLVGLSLVGTVVRKEERDQRGRYGLEFEPLPPDEEAQLGILLQMLLNSGGVGRRAHPRVATRFEVTCRTESIFRGWVNDLSKGGLGLKSVKDVPVGSALTVSFGLKGLPGLVELSCEVTSNQPMDGTFRLGVRFTPLSATEQAQVNHTLDLLLDIARSG
jgi:c-di-GMP-binding flagellar brake protein YcgR